MERCFQSLTYNIEDGLVTFSLFYCPNSVDQGLPDSSEGILRVIHDADQLNLNNKPIAIHCRYS